MAGLQVAILPLLLCALGDRIGRAPACKQLLAVCGRGLVEFADLAFHDILQKRRKDVILKTGAVPSGLQILPLCQS